MKPVPVTEAELTVTGAVPVEESLRVCVAGVFSATLPNATLVVLMLNSGAYAPSCRFNANAMLPAFAVNVAACAVATGDTIAVNAALVAFSGIITVAGTTTALLVLARIRSIPPAGAGAGSVTLQASLLDPETNVLLHDNAPKLGVEVFAPVPLPLKAIELC